ncbi:MAG: trypsin-like peptidase domain-containing protein [Actinomycetota bacterium]|nr:hypothetical protein [Actinomycetota bacterium]
MVKGTELASHTGALVLRKSFDGVEKTIRFLGTAFSFSANHSLFMTAAHVFPSEIPADHRCVIALRATNGSTRYIGVEATEVLSGQPDVLLIRTSEPVQPLAELCPVAPSVWTRVRSIGIPDALVVALPKGGFSIAGRGVAGIIQRAIPANAEPYAQGPSFELSFTVPSGASGSPIYAYTEVPSESRGLVGIALGNAESSPAAWLVDSEFIDGKWQEVKRKRVVEYGIAANLIAVRDVELTLADGLTLEVISRAENYS